MDNYRTQWVSTFLERMKRNRGTREERCSVGHMIREWRRGNNCPIEEPTVPDIEEPSYDVDPGSF